MGAEHPEVEEQRETPAADNDLARLARSVHRLTLAVWCLVGLLVSAIVVPWVSYWITSRGRSSTSESTSLNLEPESRLTGEPEFDNDFSERPLAEKVKRASVILLTRPATENGRTREIITEILKKKPSVRFYYDVGQEYEDLSRFPGVGDSDGCGDFKSAGQVVFLMGNPARMVYSTGLSADRQGAVAGGIDLARLRDLANAEQGAEK